MKTRLTEKETDLMQLLDAARLGVSELSTYPGYLSAKRSGYLVISTSARGGRITKKGSAKLKQLKRSGWKWQKDSRGQWFYGAAETGEKSERARLRRALKDV